MNLVVNKARFDGMGIQDIMTAAGLYKDMVRHCKKCEDHIFEHVASYEKPE